MASKLELPNLLIVGAVNLHYLLHNYLKQHPQIFMSAHKEPTFLINSEIGENRIHKAVLEFADYKQMFKTQKITYLRENLCYVFSISSILNQKY